MQEVFQHQREKGNVGGEGEMGEGGECVTGGKLVRLCTSQSHPATKNCEGAAL